MSRPLGARQRVLVAALSSLAGLAIIWVSVSDPDSINGPAWIGMAAGWVFVAAGLAVAFQGTPAGTWVGPIAAGGVVLGFAAIGNWIAFGPGPRACSGGISFLFFSGSADAGELECRVAFGIGAAILDGAIVMGVATGVSKLLPAAAGARVRRAGELVLGATLLPLLLLALLLSVVQGAASALWRKVRRG